MSAGISGQELLIQLETALHRLVESFWEEPYRYFTESDAVTSLWQWFAKRPGLAQVYRTKDGFETGLLHREYPTFFRLDDSNPTERLGPPARRGYYDLVLINPSYVEGHCAEVVHNRNIRRQGDRSSPPLLAAVEFKLLARTWNPENDTNVRQELGKVRLAQESPADVAAAYTCVFCRDEKAPPGSHEAYRQSVEKLRAEYPDIGFVLAASWPQHQTQSFVHYGGPWLTTETNAAK